jgi:hypothetical protein
MGERISDDLDRRRGKPPRNGAHLSAKTREALAEIATMIVADINRAAELLQSARFGRSDRAWRRECLTAEQRRAIKHATRAVRAEARKWLK